MKYFFKVKFGFGTQDYVSVEGSELEKAIYAQLKRVSVRLGNSFVNGSNIISITPLHHKYTGWNESYEPKEPDDFFQIERDCPNFDGVLEAYTDRVRDLIQTGKDNLIGTLEPLDIKQIEVSKRSDEVQSISDILKLQ